MRIATIAACMLSVTMASRAAGADHLPFTEGVIYEYERIPQSLGTFRVWFSGTTEVGGTTTHVQRVDDGQQLFWSETPEGDKYLHGTAFRLEAPLLYSPPVLVIDEPLSVGKTWEMDIQDSDGLAFHVRYDVTAFGQVTVPAGIFQAFTIAQTVTFPEAVPRGEISHFLRRASGPIETTQQVSRHSYADGVGRVLVTFGSRTDQLLSFRTVGVEGSTWTKVRMLYR